jgi:DNA-binding XRE family transcriptional regulator
VGGVSGQRDASPTLSWQRGAEPFTPETLFSRRKELGFKQAELARRRGLSAALVNKWERGTRKPSDEQWRFILHVFGGGRSSQSLVPWKPEAGAQRARTRKRMSARELTERVALGKHLRVRQAELGRTRYREYLSMLPIPLDVAAQYIRIAQRFGSFERLERITELRLPVKIIERLAAELVPEEAVEIFLHRIPLWLRQLAPPAYASSKKYSVIKTGIRASLRRCSR